MTVIPQPDDPSDFIRRIALGDERPFKDRWFPEMLAIADQAWDDVFTLLALFFEARIRVRKNPLSAADSVVRKVTPRLAELATRPFPEEPDALPGYGPFGDTSDWPKEGLLAHMGYHVGSRGPGTTRRRALLRSVFEGPLPNVVSPEYMVGWGSDRTLQRLYKLAWSIASFANARLRNTGGEADAAVTSWAEDLDWLRATFYEGHFGFPWPDLGL